MAQAGHLAHRCGRPPWKILSKGSTTQIDGRFPPVAIDLQGVMRNWDTDLPEEDPLDTPTVQAPLLCLNANDEEVLFGFEGAVVGAEDYSSYRLRLPGGITQIEGAINHTHAVTFYSPLTTTVCGIGADSKETCVDDCGTEDSAPSGMTDPPESAFVDIDLG